MVGSAGDAAGFVTPRYRGPPGVPWYHFLYGNVPNHQLDFIYSPEVPQGLLAPTHFSHMSRLMKFIEPHSATRHAFAIGNLSRDDSQYEPGRGGLALIVAMRIQGVTDHAGRRDPAFTHGVAAVSRELTRTAVLEATLRFHRVIGPDLESNGSSSGFYRNYARWMEQDPPSVPELLSTYVAEFDRMPLLPPSTLSLGWITNEAPQPKRIVIAYDERAPFGAIAHCAAKLGSMLYRSDIRWTAITTGRESDIPGGVTIRLMARNDVTSDDERELVVPMLEVSEDEAEIAQKLFGARPSAPVREARVGWRDAIGGQRRSDRPPPPAVGSDRGVERGVDRGGERGVDRGAERGTERGEFHAVTAGGSLDFAEARGGWRQEMGRPPLGSDHAGMAAHEVGTAMAAGAGGAMDARQGPSGDVRWGGSMSDAQPPPGEASEIRKYARPPSMGYPPPDEFAPQVASSAATLVAVAVAENSGGVSGSTGGLSSVSSDALKRTGEGARGSFAAEEGGISAANRAERYGHGIRAGSDASLEEPTRLVGVQVPAAGQGTEPGLGSGGGPGAAGQYNPAVPGVGRAGDGQRISSTALPAARANTGAAAGAAAAAGASAAAAAAAGRVAAAKAKAEVSAAAPDESIDVTFEPPPRRSRGLLWGVLIALCALAAVGAYAVFSGKFGNFGSSSPGGRSPGSGTAAPTVTTKSTPSVPEPTAPGGSVGAGAISTVPSTGTVPVASGDPGSPTPAETSDSKPPLRATGKKTTNRGSTPVKGQPTATATNTGDVFNAPPMFDK